MIRKPIVVSVASLCLGLLTIPAGANDTELTYGGTPRPLNGNTTVSMKSEYVKIVVGEWVTVDCRFTFENRGPARKVRMGFPDEGGEPDEEPGSKPQPPKGTFATFASWVNGRPVKTTVIRAADWGSVWHVKRVDFPANSTVYVRDRYTVDVGDSVAYYPASVHLARYVLHTGSSWHGPIGRSEIEVVFRRKASERRLLRDGCRTAAIAAVPPSTGAWTTRTSTMRVPAGRQPPGILCGSCAPAGGRPVRTIYSSSSISRIQKRAPHTGPVSPAGSVCKEGRNVTN